MLQARGARRTLGHDDGQVRRALDAIEQTNIAALSDMRRLLAVLRDTEPDSRGATTTHRSPRWNTSTSCLTTYATPAYRSTLEVVGHSAACRPGVDLSAYRIVQEALTNVLKHAGRRRPGCGSTTTRTSCGSRSPTTARGRNGIGDSGHGLIGIRERVAIVGGEVERRPRHRRRLRGLAPACPTPWSAS